MQFQRPEKMQVISSNDKKDFEKQLNKALADGWLPAGDLQPDEDGYHILMVKTKLVSIDPATGAEITAAGGVKVEENEEGDN